MLLIFTTPWKCFFFLIVLLLSCIYERILIHCQDFQSVATQTSTPLTLEIRDIIWKLSMASSGNKTLLFLILENMVKTIHAGWDGGCPTLKMGIQSKIFHLMSNCEIHCWTAIVATSKSLRESLATLSLFHTLWRLLQVNAAENDVNRSNCCSALNYSLHIS